MCGCSNVLTGMLFIGWCFLVIWGVRHRYPLAIWGASLIGLVISSLTYLGLGIVFYLVVFQLLAVAIGIRFEVDERTWWLLMIGASSIWMITVPPQYDGWYNFSVFELFPVLWLIGTVALWCWPRKSRRHWDEGAGFGERS